MELKSQLGLTGVSFAHYRIDTFIGAGGMAAVYQAFDTRLERNVAIKVLPRYSQTDEYIHRFEREARAMARLFHPNIVAIHDFGQQDQNLYLVMNLVSGGTLEKRLKGLPVPPHEVVRFLLPVVYALAYAHRHGIIHRDVKPANILMDTERRPILSDFGIAKIVTGDEGAPITRTGMGLGTPDYIAPEQGLGKKVDGRADIYSLGVIFYEMLTGSKPFTEGKGLQILMRHIMEPFPHPSLLVPDLPAEVEAVLLKMVEKDPDKRYQSMEQLANALQELQTLKNASISNVGGLFTEESAGMALSRSKESQFHCNRCGAAVYEQDKFCAECGTKLDEKTREKPPELSPQPPPVRSQTHQSIENPIKIQWMLVVVSGTQPGRQIMLNGCMEMGRSQSNAIWVNDNNASRRHAIIEPGQDGFTVTDNNSTNGTWVNGRRIGETVALKEGDQLVIGDTEFEVRRAAAADR